jgi:hypothetical protein
MSTETDRLERLLRIARDDTGGFRRVVQILLSLWNGDQYRADLQELLYLDSRLFGVLRCKPNGTVFVLPLQGP